VESPQAQSYSGRNSEEAGSDGSSSFMKGDYEGKDIDGAELRSQGHEEGFGRGGIANHSSGRNAREVP